MLQARGLTRRYGGLLALDHVSFELHPGEIVGYLGPNGSGKSTTVNLVVGLLDPSAGELSLNGVALADDPVRYKRQIGYVPEEPFLYTHLTAAEYLTLVGRMRGIGDAPLARRASRLLQLFQLHDSRYRTMSAFSKGMRQRVLLAAALLHDPDLLIFDEPFSGLDVNASLMLRSLLQALQRRGKMILFSSHQMDVVETLCRRVLILYRGRVAAEGSPQELRSARVAESLEEVFAAVTEQEDYAAKAEAILNAGHR
jgi:ABC-type multidrug transport system, ATPase component